MEECGCNWVSPNDVTGVTFLNNEKNKIDNIKKKYNKKKNILLERIYKKIKEEEINSNEYYQENKKYEKDKEDKEDKKNISISLTNDIDEEITESEEEEKEEKEAKEIENNDEINKKKIIYILKKLDELI